MNTNNSNLYPIDLIIDSIIAKFNPHNSSNLNIIYEFNITGYSPIYLEVKDGFCKIMRDQIPSKIDTSIKISHDVLQKICLHEITSQDALIENLVKCDGEIKNYFILTNLLEKESSVNLTKSKEQIPIKQEIKQPENIDEDSIDKVFDASFDEKPETPLDINPTLEDTYLDNNLNSIIDVSIPNDKNETPLNEPPKSQMEVITQTVVTDEPLPIQNTKSPNDSNEKAEKKTRNKKEKPKKVKKPKEKKVKEPKIKPEKPKKVKNPKNKKDNSNKLIPINSIIRGMVAGFEPSKADSLNIKYKFLIGDHKPIYIEIKNKTAKLFSRYSGEVDTTIKTSHQTLHDMSFNNLNLESALSTGIIQCEGDLKNYYILKELFTTVETNDPEHEINLKLTPTIWLLLALVPWIFYWATHQIFSSLITSSFAILYTTLFSAFLKPSKFKRLTKLESLTIIVFAFYHLINILNPVIFNDIVSSFFLNVILILMFFMSIGTKFSVIGEYSQINSDESMIKTKLFRLINKNLTILWAIILTMRFVLDLVLEWPLNNISYIFILIGALISYIYPKLKLGR